MLAQSDRTSDLFGVNVVTEDQQGSAGIADVLVHDAQCWLILGCDTWSADFSLTLQRQTDRTLPVLCAPRSKLPDRVAARSISMPREEESASHCPFERPSPSPKALRSSPRHLRSAALVNEVNRQRSGPWLHITAFAADRVPPDQASRTAALVRNTHTVPRCACQRTWRVPDRLADFVLARRPGSAGSCSTLYP
jgi:hypothetical protein